jgi:two-component system phosphate regulon response regulator PhoB
MVSIGTPDKQCSETVAGTHTHHTQGPMFVFDVELDWDQHRIRRQMREIHLSALETRLLRFLMEEPRRLFSREELMKGVWPAGITVGPRTVDVHIASLRKALTIPGAPNPVRTVRGRGYSFDMEDDSCGTGS